MQLQFKSNGTSIENFTAWLKGFMAIQKSLLLEIDIDRQMFVAKAMPVNKLGQIVRTIVKYSSISFENAGMEFFGVYDENGVKVDWADYKDKTEDGRVKIGFYEILSKAIEVYKLFSNVDYEMHIDFDLCNDITYAQTKNIVREYQANNIMIKSKSLTMKITTSTISEYFCACDDNTFFDKVCHINSPSTYEVSIESFNNLLKIVSIYATDKSKECIKFYSKQEGDTWALYAYDDNHNSFDYLLGYYGGGEAGHTETFIFTQRFEDSIKSLNSDSLSITLDTAGASKMLIESADAKIVISAVQK